MLNEGKKIDHIHKNCILDFFFVPRTEKKIR